MQISLRKPFGEELFLGENYIDVKNRKEHYSIILQIRISRMIAYDLC